MSLRLKEFLALLNVSISDTPVLWDTRTNPIDAAFCSDRFLIQRLVANTSYSRVKHVKKTNEPSVSVRCRVGPNHKPTSGRSESETLLIRSHREEDPGRHVDIVYADAHFILLGLDVFTALIP